MRPPESDYDCVLMVIGGRSDLSRNRALMSAHQVKIIAEEYPTAELSLHIDGFDDDPRELPDIPEAAAFIKIFAARLHAIGLPPRFAERLGPASLKWSAVNLGGSHS